jgi:hypothetical protein
MRSREGTKRILTLQEEKNKLKIIKNDVTFTRVFSKDIILGDFFK